ncbi:hypothetical protein [Haloferula sargassicola]|uniref:hypothetical protein n=1 Tax=Haloferula sargassicola TaxID=490096 RepID=UPI0033656030
MITKAIHSLEVCWLCLFLLLPHSFGEDPPDEKQLSAIQFTQSIDKEGGYTFEIENASDSAIAGNISLEARDPNGGKWMEVYSDVFEETLRKAAVVYTVPRRAKIVSSCNLRRASLLIDNLSVEVRLGFSIVGGNTVYSSPKLVNMRDVRAEDKR